MSSSSARAGSAHRSTLGRDHAVPSRPGGECLGSDDRSRSHGRPAPPSGGEARTGPREMCPEHRSMSVPGGLRRSETVLQAEGQGDGCLRRARLGRAASPGPRARHRWAHTAHAARGPRPGGSRAASGSARCPRWTGLGRSGHRAPRGAARGASARLGPSRLPGEPQGGSPGARGIPRGAGQERRTRRLRSRRPATPADHGMATAATAIDDARRPSGAGP